MKVENMFKKNRNGKTLHVFDLDGVLFKVNFDVDKQHMFLKIDNATNIEKNLEFFNSLPEDQKCILTTRHPVLRKQLEEKFNCSVCCRNFALSKFRMKLNQKFKFFDNWFLDQMVKYKINELNLMWEILNYEKILFYDDQADRFTEHYSKLWKGITLIHVTGPMQFTILERE